MCRGGGIANGKDNEAFIVAVSTMLTMSAMLTRATPIAHTPSLEGQSNRQM